MTEVPESVPPLARGPVLAIAGGLGVLLLVTSGRYGYFGDELYFLAAGRRLDWGYADQPPLLPLLARAMDTAFPGSLAELRLPVVPLAVLGVVVAALLARELGGHARAQVLTAAVSAIPVHLVISRMLFTATVDAFLWTLVTWLLVRWVRVRQDRLLLWAGLATAVALQAKLLIAGYWLVLGISVLIVGPRALLRRRMLLRSPDLRPYRFLGVAVVGLTAVFLLTEGLRWLPTWPAYLVSAAIAVVVALPVRPIWMLGPLDLPARGSLGWPELADTVAATYRSLPPQARPGAVVVTAQYWQAAALDQLGPDRDCPVHTARTGVTGTSVRRRTPPASSFSSARMKAICTGTSAR